MGLPISVSGDIAEETFAFEAVEFSAHGAYFPAGETCRGRWRNPSCERGRVVFVLGTFFILEDKELVLSDLLFTLSKNEV